jgi:zinc/manganese transport system substrate-binding protein
MNNIKKTVALLLVFGIVLYSNEAFARVRVVTTIPDFGSIAREIGGDKIEVKSIVKGYQDPHFVDAKPNYILWLNKADLLIYNGLELESGWLPILLTGSRNSKISSPNATGHLNASTLITNLLEVPTAKIDKSKGDIHPGGNSHYLLDPRNGLLIAEGIAERLKSIDPDNSQLYIQNLQEFTAKLKEQIKLWEEKLKPLDGTNVVTYHKSWVYFTAWAGFKEIGYIEPKPGIPPSPSHIAGLVKSMQDKNLKLILSESFYPQKTANLVAQKTGAILLVLPTMVDRENGVSKYSDLFETIVNKIINAL